MFNFLTVAAAEAPAKGAGGLISFVPMILIFVVMFYFMFRSQKKQAQKRQQMVDKIIKGDDVIIAGGIHGIIITVKDKTFIVEIADKVNVEINKAGVNGITSNDPKCCGMSK